MKESKTKKPIIELEDVWKIYRLGHVEVPAVMGLSLKVYRNEFIAVMGPSGSGKSTCMNMIGCLDVPTRGKILLDGVDISALSESDLAQIRGSKIGFVFQTFNLMPSLTAFENVSMPMIFHNIAGREREERAYMLLESVGLKDRLNHKPEELSGGERQRVAIARALSNNPEVILADEPTGNLDSKTGHEIIGMFTELNKKEGKTIIIVTHDPDIAEHAQRIVHLRDGKITDGGRGEK